MSQKRSVSSEDRRLARNAARRKLKEVFAEKNIQQASLRNTRARQEEESLKARSKATGKTVTQLIVESWDE